MRLGVLSDLSFVFLDALDIFLSRCSLKHVMHVLDIVPPLYVLRRTNRDVLKPSSLMTWEDVSSRYTFSLF